MSLTEQHQIIIQAVVAFDALDQVPIATPCLVGHFCTSHRVAWNSWALVGLCEPDLSVLTAGIGQRGQQWVMMSGHRSGYWRGPRQGTCLTRLQKNLGKLPVPSRLGYSSLRLKSGLLMEG